MLLCEIEAIGNNRERSYRNRNHQLNRGLRLMAEPGPRTRPAWVPSDRWEAEVLSWDQEPSYRLRSVTLVSGGIPTGADTLAQETRPANG